MPKMIDPVTVKDALYGLPDIIDANWQSDSESWRTIKKDRKGGFYEKLWGQIPRNVGDTESIAKLKNNIISGCTGTLHSKSSKSVMLPYLLGKLIKFQDLQD